MEGDDTSRALLSLALLIESSPHLSGWQSLPLPFVIDNLLLRNWTISALHNNTSPQISYESIKSIQNAIKAAPGDDIRTTGATVAYIVLTVFAATSVYARMYSRRIILKKKKFKVEDWVIWLSMLLSLGLAGILVYGDYSAAFGSHIYLISWNTFKRSLFMTYLSTILYLGAITVARTAILLVFLTFSTDIRYRIGCYSLGFFNITIFIVRICFVILQCHPMDYWNDPMNQACIGNPNVYEIILGCCSAVIDAGLVFMPTTIMHGLKLPKRDKWMTLGIFVVGLVATTASIFRIFAVMWVINTSDKSFHQPPLGIWSSVEVNLAIACACGPSLRSIILSRTDKNFRRRWSRRPPPVLTTSMGHSRAYHHREIVTHRVDSALSNRSDTRRDREKGMRDASGVSRTTPRSPYSPCSPTSRGSPRIHVHGPQGEVITIDAEGGTSSPNDVSSGSNTPSTSGSSSTGGTGIGSFTGPYLYGTYGRRPSVVRSRSGSAGTNASSSRSRDGSTSRREGTVTSGGSSRREATRSPTGSRREGTSTPSGSRREMTRTPSGGNRRPSDGSRGGRRPSDDSGGGGGLRIPQSMDDNRVTVSADTIAAMIEEEEEEERMRDEARQVDTGDRSWLHV